MGPPINELISMQGTCQVHGRGNTLGIDSIVGVQIAEVAMLPTTINISPANEAHNVSRTLTGQLQLYTYCCMNFVVSSL